MRRLLVLVAIAAASLSMSGIASASIIRHCAGRPAVGGGPEPGHYFAYHIVTYSLTCNAAVHDIRRGVVSSAFHVSIRGFACGILKHATRFDVILCRALDQSFWFRLA
jgi:hypothetical protein